MTKLWLAIGFAGQLLFTSRFLVQWIASEKRRQSIVPTAFWWLSLGGASLLLAYAIWRQDPVFILGYETALRTHRGGAVGAPLCGPEPLGEADDDRVARVGVSCVIKVADQQRGHNTPFIRSTFCRPLTNANYASCTSADTAPRIEHGAR